MTSSGNESLKSDSSESESVDSENGNGNCVQIPISNYEQGTEHETDFEMGWEWIFPLDHGPSVGPFLGEEMLLMDQKKNEPHNFFEALFEAEIWNYIVHQTNRYAETRITQRCKKKQILIVLYSFFFNMLHDIDRIFNMFLFS